MPARRTGRWQRVLRIGHDLLPLFLILQLHKFKNTEERKERNDEYVGRAEEYKAAKSALLEGLGLEHLFDHSHELTPKEKEIWMLFDRVDVAELLARDAFAKGAYMLGAEDREIMLK